MRNALFALMLVPFVASATPSTLQQQGRLLDSTGEPLSGEHQLTFRFYDSDVATSAFWTESHDLSLEEGYYSTTLGNGLDPALLDQSAVWLGITIDTGDELPGRQRLGSVPFALRSAVADTLACPSDMVDTGGFCIDRDDHLNSNWQDAAATCVSEGKRLCSMAEWSGACQNAATLGLQDMTDNHEYVDEYWSMHYSPNGTYYSAFISVGNGNCERIYYSGWGCENSTCYDTTNPGKSGYAFRCCK